MKLKPALRLMALLITTAAVVSAFQDYITLGVESDLLNSDIDTAIGNFRLATMQLQGKRQVGYNNLGVALMRKALSMSNDADFTSGTEQVLLNSAADALERAIEL